MACAQNEFFIFLIYALVFTQQPFEITLNSNICCNRFGQQQPVLAGMMADGTYLKIAHMP